MSKAIVKDNEILVLGGLINDATQEVETKVPFLGDIPILGWLFKGTKKSVVKRNLMVFIHPKIMRNASEDRDITVDSYQKMRTLQEFYNKNTDFLTIRNGHPILKELPLTMIDPESSLVKESMAVDVITVKKDELSLPIEEPVVNPIVAPTTKNSEEKKANNALESTIGSNIPESGQSAVKVQNTKPKNKKPKLPKPVVTQPETQIIVPVDQSPAIQPVSPPDVDAVNATTTTAVEEKTPTNVTESQPVATEPATTPTTTPVVQ